MIYTKNRLFAKYGHECNITVPSNKLLMYVSSSRTSTRIRRWCVRMRMASEVNSRANNFLRSQGALAKEHYNHLPYLHMIHPFSNIRIVWEAFMILIFFLHFITIPIDVFVYNITKFHKVTPHVSFCIVRTILDFCTLVDCAMNFFTGYVHKTKIILKPRTVAIHYLKTYFVVDLVSSIPTHLHLFLPLDTHKSRWRIIKYLSLLKFFRLYTFKVYCRNLTEVCNFRFVTKIIVYLVTLYFMLYHFTCCLLLYIYGYVYTYESGIYYTVINNEKKIVSTGYANTFYQATMIICQSNFPADMEMETLKIIIIFIWVISKFLYIFLLSKVVIILISVTSSKHKYVEMVRQLKEYMHYKLLPDYMQKRLLTYYEFRFQKSYFREHEILNTVSGQLRQEIVMHLCRKLVENVDFFKNLPLNLLLRIVSCLKSEIFLLNDVIIRANTTGDCMYFIASGTVAVFTKSGKEITHLEDGAHFGEIALVMKDKRRAASVVAVEVCELYRLDRKDFVRTVDPYPDLLYSIQYIAADRLERSTLLNNYTEMPEGTGLNIDRDHTV